MLYRNIQINILKHIRSYTYPGDLIRILYELCQKRVIRDNLFKDGTVQKWFNKLDIYRLNPQDFLNLGHILNNPVVKQFIDKKIYEEYLKNLKFMSNNK